MHLFQQIAVGVIPIMVCHYPSHDCLYSDDLLDSFYALTFFFGQVIVGWITGKPLTVSSNPLSFIFSKLKT